MHTNYTNIGIIGINSYVSIDTMRHYELTCLISSELTTEELNPFQEKIISHIRKEKGILIKTNKTTKKNLGSPIGKKNQAFLLSLDFQINPGDLENLEKKLKQEPQILRYLISTKPPTAFRKELISKPPIALRKKVAGGKVELREIEKKLEEILGE